LVTQANVTRRERNLREEHAGQRGCHQHGRHLKRNLAHVEDRSLRPTVVRLVTDAAEGRDLQPGEARMRVLRQERVERVALDAEPFPNSGRHELTPLALRPSLRGVGLLYEEID
jgi:hypothetical protein